MVPEWLEGWKTHIAVALGVIVCVLGWYGIVPPETRDMLIAALGFGAISLLRWGQRSEAIRVKEEVQDVKQQVSMSTGVPPQDSGAFRPPTDTGKPL